MIIFLWLYYSKLYIFGSIIVTYVLNKLTDKLYYPPLIINMVSVILLIPVSSVERLKVIYLNYMPVVITSVLMNIIIYVYRKIKFRNRR